MSRGSPATSGSSGASAPTSGGTPRSWSTGPSAPASASGGHISTYASSATLYEVGFNHFFRGKDHDGGGDQIYFQGHASPGMYARAFLEGRLTEHQMDGFRQELSHPGGGLSSYPHPRLMPEFWEFPTVSMGLGPLNAIYQARFNRYLHNRGIKDTSDQRVWAFLGDGEMDEPESLGAIGLAAREELDNLTFVINCNLQRLDGPVRGNGKVIQELESFFRGAGWNVIKVVWGRKWDELLARDSDGALVNIMNTTPDGDFQTYKAEDGAFIREHFFGRDPRARKLVEDWSDADIWSLQRGGHDYRKMYAAYAAAVEHTGQPTVILAKTIKGWTLGSHFEGRNSTHQMKKLSIEDLRTFRDRLQMPIDDEHLDAKLPPYVHPGQDSDVYKYLMERRHALGGGVPQRRAARGQAAGAPRRRRSTTSSGAARASRRSPPRWPSCGCFKDLLKDEGIGPRFVPIIPDEARTFGMDSLFPTLKVYNPHGPDLPVGRPRAHAAPTRSPTTGVILHEGINEAGSVASFTAVGTSYATHGEPMIPIYIFYSMFGFQRTGDAFWAAADQMARGFVLGATAGRTTLNGEGLQHEDGHSPLLASTNPAVVAYDPAFGFEIGHIVRDGLRRMYGEDAENVFYYLTIYNEPYVQPAEPAGRRRRRHPPWPPPVEAGAHRRGGSPRPAAGLRRRGAVGREGSGSAAGRLGRARGRVVGDVVERAAPRRPRGRGVEPQPSRRGAAAGVRHRQARRAPGPGGRGVGLHACRAGPDPRVGAAGLRLPRH